MIYKDNKIAFVEVKGGNDKLRDNQKAMLKMLTNNGLKCYIWNPKTGFKQLKPQLRTTPPHCIASVKNVLNKK